MDNKNPISIICDIVSVIIGFLIAIFAVIMLSNQIHWIVILPMCFGMFLSGLIIKVLGEIVNQLTISNQNKRQTSNNIKYYKKKISINPDPLFEDNPNKTKAQKEIENKVYSLYAKRKLPIDYSAPIEEQREEIRKIVEDKTGRLI